MSKYNFDEEYDNNEPTFSLADFRKWLGKQGKDEPETKMEAKEPPVRNEEEEKQAFKDKLKKRRAKKKE